MRHSAISPMLSLALLGTVAAVSGGCSSPPPNSPGADDFNSNSGTSDNVASVFGMSSAAVTIEIPSCSVAGTSGYVAATGAMTINLSLSTSTEVVIAPVNGYLRVNGRVCIDGTGTAIPLTKLFKLTVNGTSGNDTVVLDTYLGAFGSRLTGKTVAATATDLASGGGIVVALGAGAMDRVGVHTGGGADTVTAGSSTDRTFVDFDGDKLADTVWTSTATRRELMLATADGNDIISGTGRQLTATADGIAAQAGLAGTAIAAGGLGSVAATYTMSILAGPGNDKIQAGLGADLLDGGDGDDIFVTAATRDGADIFLGGLGTDLVDYSARTANLTVTIAPSSAINADDGEPTEGDDVTSSVESVTGGSGNDKLVGSTSANVLTGGAGTDTLNGGPAGTCTADLDRLVGGDGNDIFEMNASNDCADEVVGGLGADLVDYRDRNVALSISQDAVANDGETNERDNIGSDVEVIVGGQAADTITGGLLSVKLFGCAGDDIIKGSAADDDLAGGPGNDILSGLAGEDRFFESGDEPLCYSSVRGVTASLRGSGSDTINGGAGIVDLVDYAGRTAALTITLCTDATAVFGLGTACATPRNDGESSEGDVILNTEVVEGGTGNDTITGSAADEWLWGNDGDDTINGASGNDHLDGGRGVNTLAGGIGADICQNYVQATDCDLYNYSCNVGTRRDCDNAPENACEADIATSRANCGGCGIVCPGGQLCSGSLCVTDPGATSATSCSTCGLTGDGLSNCGTAGNESCAQSLLVTGGTFVRDAGAQTMIVSDFRLDKYEVTVARFRSFAQAWLNGWRPASGSGKHTHLRAGAGLTSSGGGDEGGWDSTWDSFVGRTASWNGSVFTFSAAPTNLAGWTTALRCDPTLSTWSATASGTDRFAQNCINWADIQAFCIWDGGFLPSETEWEYAAAGGSSQRTYPWGANTPTGYLANFQNSSSCFGSSASCPPDRVGQVGQALGGFGRFGQADLAGNVREWALDWANNPAIAGCTNCADLVPSTFRVTRGGGFNDAASAITTAYRNSGVYQTRVTTTGGRCARTP